MRLMDLSWPCPADDQHADRDVPAHQWLVQDRRRFASGTPELWIGRPALRIVVEQLGLTRAEHVLGGAVGAAGVCSGTVPSATVAAVYRRISDPGSASYSTTIVAPLISRIVLTASARALGLSNSVWIVSFTRTRIRSRRLASCARLRMSSTRPCVTRPMIVLTAVASSAER